MKEYRDLRAKFRFLDLCKRPDLAAEMVNTLAGRIPSWISKNGTPWKSSTRVLTIYATGSAKKRSPRAQRVRVLVEYSPRTP